MRRAADVLLTVAPPIALAGFLFALKGVRSPSFAEEMLLYGVTVALFFTVFAVMPYVNVARLGWGGCPCCRRVVSRRVIFEVTHDRMEPFLRDVVGPVAGTAWTADHLERVAAARRASPWWVLRSTECGGCGSETIQLLTRRYRAWVWASEMGTPPHAVPSGGVASLNAGVDAHFAALRAAQARRTRS